VRVALLLILLLAALVLVGTLLDQVPPPIASDAAAYERWLGLARGKYGVWTGTFDRLQFFQIFHALYFRALLALLAVNIVVCTVNRWRGIWLTVFHTRVRASEAFLVHARHHARFEAAMPAQEAAARLRTRLARARYRVSVEDSPGSVALFADKNRLSRFGTFLSHLSLVLILLGAMAGGVWGFVDPGFTVAQGSTRDLGLGTGLSLRLNEFADQYDAQGMPSDYRGDVALLEHGRLVKTGVVRVNSPLRYKGVAFHLGSFGQAAVMNVRDSAGDVIFSGGVPLSMQTSDGQYPVGAFDLPDQGLSVYVLAPRPGEPGGAIRPGDIRMELYRNYVRVASPAVLSLGVPVEFEDLTFTFERETRFVGFKVVKNPGMNIVWAACGFMMAGLVMLFYFPRRSLWLLCSDRPGGSSEILVGMPAQRDFSLTAEFERVRARLAAALETET